MSERLPEDTKSDFVLNVLAVLGGLLFLATGLMASFDYIRALL